MKNINENESKPLVSIIVPVYNVWKYLDKCIKSLILQSYTNIEIILVDDGSQDSSGSICRKYAQLDSRIHALQQDNGGVTSARKNGFAHSNGEFILFVDSDDYVSPYIVERMLVAQKKYHADIVSCQYYEGPEGKMHFHETDLPTGFYTHRQIRNDIFPVFLYNVKTKEEGIKGYLCTRLFRRSLVSSALQAGEGMIFSEDKVGLFKAFYLADGIYIMNDPLYYYVEHKGQVTRKYNPLYWNNFELYFKRLKKIDTEHFLDRQIPNQAFVILKMLVKMEFENTDLCFPKRIALLKEHFSEFLFKLSQGANKNFSWKDKEYIQYYLLKHKCFFIYGCMIKIFSLFK